MQNFTIKVVSVLPPGISHAKYPEWVRHIQAEKVNSAIMKYKNIMESQLPAGYCYELIISNNQGQSEAIKWNK